jgi:hypothetical protein
MLGKLMMKLRIALLLVVAAVAQSLAGESALTQTVQPLDGLGSGEIVIAPVMCHDWSSHSGMPTAIGLITAKNIPPTNAPKPVEDINIASACGLVLTYAEDKERRGVVTLDCRALRIPLYLGCTELEAVGVTLECLRKVAGANLNKMTIVATLKPDGQETIGKLVEAFKKHAKDQPFPWK